MAHILYMHAAHVAMPCPPWHPNTVTYRRCYVRSTASHRLVAASGLVLDLLVPDMAAVMRGGYIN